MRSIAFALTMSLSVPALSAPGDLGRFLKSCAWGTGLGAAAGAVTLAFEEKPGEHTVNIARGASLGLYAGIAYGLLQAQKKAPIPETVRVLPVLLPTEAGVVAVLRF